MASTINQFAFSAESQDIQTHPWVKHLGFESVHIFSTRLIKTFILKWKQRRIITISEVQGLFEVVVFYCSSVKITVGLCVCGGILVEMPLSSCYSIAPILRPLLIKNDSLLHQLVLT